MQDEDVPAAFWAAATELYENHPRRKEKIARAADRAERSRARFGPGRWRYEYPNTYREWSEAAHQAVDEWRHRGGWELRYHPGGRIRIYPARRCAGVCRRWLADCDPVPRLDRKLCGARECRSAYELARRQNQRGGWNGPTVAARPKRSEHRRGDEPVCVGVIDWLNAYTSPGSSPVPAFLLCWRDGVERARELRAIDPIEHHFASDDEQQPDQVAVSQNLQVEMT